MGIYVGTSGWQYRDWRGVLYPPGLAQSRWLEYYAGCYGTVENNGAFYRLPSQETFAGWRARTPEGFVMAVKASRYLTHIRRLRDPAEPVQRLMRAAAGLGDRLGPVLLQLPPNLPADAGALDDCLGEFSRFPGVRVAVEFRHESWWADDIRQLLTRRNAALCWADRLGRPLGPLWRTADWGYLRLHEGRARPWPRYGCGRRCAAGCGGSAPPGQARRTCSSTSTTTRAGPRPVTPRPSRRWPAPRAVRYPGPRYPTSTLISGYDWSVASWVLHVDLDQFIAAVEVLRRPELAGRPVVVGGDGDPAKRGVVSTASYEARAHGVHSGLPLRTAARRCPQAVFLPVDKQAYEAVSARVMAALRESGAALEVMGWDEAFLGTDHDDPESFARELQRRVRDATRLDCTVGIGQNKLQAKLATGFGKPAGIFRLTYENWSEVLGARPPDAAVGHRPERPPSWLRQNSASAPSPTSQPPTRSRSPGSSARSPGPGWYCWRAVTASARWTRRRTSFALATAREITFQRNIADWTQVRAEVARLADLVAGELASERRPAVRVVVKVRYAPFVTQTHGHPLAVPTVAAAPLRQAALAALDKFTGRRPVRLLGVRAEFATGGR